MIEKKELKYDKAVLIGIVTHHQNEAKCNEYLDELDFLTYTAGAKPVKRFIQKLNIPHPKTFIGTGKINEIKEFIAQNQIGIAIFDDELSAIQLRNIEKILDCKVLDRTNLILDIFSQRASTSYACTQVELAQYQYILPRLTRMWTHLERQKGGIGMRGPGETQIETDRRIIVNKISLLKNKLKAIDKQMSMQRKNRGKMVRVSLIGYTNVGKSTLMNLMGKTNILAENKLFATLDTTVRKIVIENIPFLMTDTVGFIRKLPTQLVESFKSTLDEVREADLLLHIVDISHPNFEDHITSVNKILTEIEVINKPMLMIFNKIDNFTFEKKDKDDLTLKTKENYSLEELEKMWLTKTNNNSLFISATKKQNIENLKNELYSKIKEIHQKRFPYNDYLYFNYDEQGNIKN